MKYCVGVLRVTLHLPHSHSLKERRSAVSSAKERLKSKFNLSIFEEPTESWQICNLAIACVGESETRVDQALRNSLNELEKDDRLSVLSPSVEYYV
ncbi:DUF503 domain-containing protein [bacterium]|nr:DUF503 domain-containing protein [bacterium]